MHGGRTAMAKLESRIKELEIELGVLQSRTGENTKHNQKAERKIKELAFQIEEDTKNQVCAIKLLADFSDNKTRMKTSISSKARF